MSCDGAPARRLAALAAGIALFGFGAPARAQDDGPRVYQLAPVGAWNLTAFLVNKRGNEEADPGSIVPGSQIDTDILVVRYAETFRVADRPVTPFLILPVGSVRASGAPESSGLGDVQVGGTIGLIGTPALSPQAFATFKPGFGLGVLGRVYFPSGAYSSATSVNLGSNRVAWQVGLPAVFAVGRSYRDPSLTSLEILPTATFYSGNDEPFNGDHSSKSVFYSVEAHLTRNLAPRVWVSADMLFRSGGVTTTDGLANANGVQGWSAGLSAAIPFVSISNLIFTYQHVVERSDDGPDGWFFRVALVLPF